MRHLSGVIEKQERKCGRVRLCLCVVERRINEGEGDFLALASLVCPCVSGQCVYRPRVVLQRVYPGRRYVRKTGSRPRTCVRDKSITAISR